MNAGELDRRITLYSRTRSQDSTGAYRYSYSSYGSRWAKIEWGGGSEGSDEGVERAIAEATFTIRYDASVTTDYVVVYDPGGIIDSTDFAWEIIAVEQEGRQKYMKLKCRYTELNDI